MSLGNHRQRQAMLKPFRKAQLGTCGIRHGVASTAMGSRKRTQTHSIDTVDARRQVRQEKKRTTKATRLHNKRIAKEEIND